MDSSCGQEALDEVILAKPSRPETERQRARSKLLINEHSGASAAQIKLIEYKPGFSSLIRYDKPFCSQ